MLPGHNLFFRCFPEPLKKYIFLFPTMNNKVEMGNFPYNVSLGTEVDLGRKYSLYSFLPRSPPAFSAPEQTLNPNDHHVVIRWFIFTFTHALAFSFSLPQPPSFPLWFSLSPCKKTILPASFLTWLENSITSM